MLVEELRASLPHVAELLDRLPDRFSRGIAKDPPGSRVEGADQALLIHGHNAIDCIIQHRLAVCAGGDQRCGDIVERARDLPELVAIVELHRIDQRAANHALGRII